MIKNAWIKWGMSIEFTTPEFLLGYNLSADIPDRFISKVEKSNGCWIWKGCTNKKCKYGYIAKGFNQSKSMLAHRVSFLLCKGHIFEGSEICHSCDNRACVNPEHLWQGTHSANMTDGAIKKRFNNGHHLTLGSKNGKSVLDEIQVLEIVKLSKGGMSQRQIAKQYGTSQPAIAMIMTGRNWSHVTGINVSV